MGQKRRAKQQRRKRRRGLPTPLVVHRLAHQVLVVAIPCSDPTCLSDHGARVKGAER